MDEVKDSICLYTIADRAHGYGHLQRCLVLADEFKRRGVGCVFVTEAGSAPVVARINAAGYSCFEFHPDDRSWLAQFARREDTHCNIVIIDVEGGPEFALLDEARGNYQRVIVIGGSGYTLRDPQAVREYADVWLAQSVLKVDGATAQGPDYIIIDPDYAELTANPDGHILISMGGSDPHGLTSQAIAALQGIGQPIIAVNGPAAVGAESGDGWTLVHSPQSLKPYLDGAALFVGALGMTAYEAAAAGVPALLTAWSTDHEQTTLEFERRGCAVNLGLWDRFDGEFLRGQSEAILSDRDEWLEMHEAALALVDGEGAVRAADVILGLL